MKLESAYLYYGTSRYPINFIFDEEKEFLEIPLAPVGGAALDAVCEAIARHSGCLSFQNVKDRITHNVATEAYEVPVADDSVVSIPAYVHLIGNGFSVIWK